MPLDAWEQHLLRDIGVGFDRIRESMAGAMASGIEGAHARQLALEYIVVRLVEAVMTIAMTTEQEDELPAAPLLTARQCEILQQLSTGASASEIARALGLSIHTVHTHLRDIYRRLGVSGAAAALHRARQLGLIPQR